MGKLTDVAIRAGIRSGERFEGHSEGDSPVPTWREKRTASSWRLRYRFAGKPRGREIGSYSSLTLAAAPQAAKALRAWVALGRDVAGEKQERTSAALDRIEAARSVATVGQLADEYFERMLDGRWKHRNTVGSRSLQNELTVKLLLPLAVRKGELIAARWDEFELEADTPVWHLPGIRTKTGQPLDIPPPSMAVEWLLKLKEPACNAAYVLPARKLQARRVPHVCESTLGVAMGKVESWPAPLHGARRPPHCPHTRGRPGRGAARGRGAA